MTSTLFRFPEVWRPLLTRIAPGPTIEQPTPVRKLDPTCRLSGWKTLASEVDRLRDQVRHEEGHSPYLATMNWFTPGELGFYCQGHPEVYSFGAALDDRHSQYDFWHPNPLADAQAFRGATFVYVGEINPRLVEAFERIDPPVEVTASDGGVPTAHWRIRVLRGFRGFPEDPRVQREAGY